MRTIGRNDHGAAVEDVQRRLRVMGYELAVDGAYLQRTCDAVKMFRQSEGLPPGDFVDQQAWAALVDASFALGDRMLYLAHAPFSRGRRALVADDPRGAWLRRRQVRRHLWRAYRTRPARFPAQRRNHGRRHRG